MCFIFHAMMPIDLSSPHSPFFYNQVLVRIVGADVHMYSNFNEVMQWLADGNLLEMIVDKLSPKVRLLIILTKVILLCDIFGWIQKVLYFFLNLVTKS